MIVRATDGFAYGDPRFEGEGWRIEPTDYGMRVIVKGPREMNWNTVLKKLKGFPRKCLTPLSTGEQGMSVFGNEYVKSTSFDIRINEPTPVPTAFTARLKNYDESVA